MRYLLFVLLIFVSLACAAPAPLFLVGNSVTGECRTWWPGDEYSSYPIPTGFSELAAEFENPDACYEFRCNYTGGSWNAGTATCQCSDPNKNSKLYGCANSIEQQIESSAASKVCTNSGGSWSQVNHLCSCGTGTFSEAWYYSNSGCSGGGDGGNDNGSLDSLLACCCPCPSALVPLALLFISIPSIIIHDERGKRKRSF